MKGYIATYVSGSCVGQDVLEQMFAYTYQMTSRLTRYTNASIDIIVASVDSDIVVIR